MLPIGSALSFSRTSSENVSGTWKGARHNTNQSYHILSFSEHNTKFIFKFVTPIHYGFLVGKLQCTNVECIYRTKHTHADTYAKLIKYHSIAIPSTKRLNL